MELQRTFVNVSHCHLCGHALAGTRYHFEDYTDHERGLVYEIGVCTECIPNPFHT